MDRESFTRDIESASTRLRLICPDGNLDEAEVREVVRKTGLPMKLEDDSFVLDPIRLAVVVHAYKVGGDAKVFLALEHAWKYYSGLKAKAA
jgi:hypothetical protein